MLIRFRAALLLVSFFALGSGIAFAASPTIEVVVPGYRYPQGDGTDIISEGIANNGTTVGSTVFGSFLRFADGEFSPPFDFPGASLTEATGVNSSNLVCGTYFVGSQYVDHGFFYDGTDFTQYDVPGAANTNVEGINDAGDFCGYYNDVSGSKAIPFINTGGTLVTFDIPGATDIYASGINNLGQVVGSYSTAEHNARTRGFFRDADGTLTYPLHFPGSISTFPKGINDQGIIAGYYSASSSTHGFLLKLPPGAGSISYNYFDDSDSTMFAGINNSLLISGNYTNRSFTYGFIAQLAR